MTKQFMLYLDSFTNGHWFIYPSSLVKINELVSFVLSLQTLGHIYIRKGLWVILPVQECFLNGKSARTGNCTRNLRCFLFLQKPKYYVVVRIIIIRIRTFFWIQCRAYSRHTHHERAKNNQNISMWVLIRARGTYIFDPVHILGLLSSRLWIWERKHEINMFTFVKFHLRVF